MRTYDKEAVRTAAAGRWREVFEALAPALKPALAVPGRHVACPKHGGENGFRLFKNFEAKGDSICNSCGANTDGFATLMFVNGWNFARTVREVGQFLGVFTEDANRIAKVNKTVEGKLEFSGYIQAAGKDYRIFTVRIRTSQGMVKLQGKDLERCLREISAINGDNIRIVHLYRRELTHGRTYNVFSAAKLESDMERALKLIEQKRIDQKCRTAIKALWEHSVQLADDPKNPLWRYLTNRGIDPRLAARCQDIRFAPRLVYSRELRDQPFAGMTCAVRDLNGHIVTIHRTFLADEGQKAPVDEPKKLMQMSSDTELLGAAIRLAQPVNGLLAVTEGVETALSVQQATGLSTWAAITAVGMEHLAVPDTVKVVLIFADKDRSRTGEIAARSLARRLTEQGKAVVILIPDGEIPQDKKGIDWNDVLVEKGTVAFPVFIP